MTASTELESYTPPRVQASLPAKIEYARELANSGLLPDAYRRQPANVLYAVEYGDMLGLPPMAAITGIHIIEGKPTASAGLISALVRRAGHKLRVGYDADKRMGWAEIVRSDDPTYTFRSEWDLERAVTAELCTIKDGKPFALDSKGRSKPWRKFFPSMTKARAITEVARDACEEALYGLHYTPEELGADVDGEGNVIGGTIVPDQPAPANGPAASVNQEWLEQALAAALNFSDENAGRKLWDEVVAQRKAGRITTADCDRVKDLIRARWKLQAEAAEAAAADEGVVDGEIVPELPPESPWAASVEAITSTDDAVALASEVGQQLADGKLDDQTAIAIHAAIAAREAAVSQDVAA